MAERLSYVIIGNGIAGVTAAETLRQEQPSAEITIIAETPTPACHRPALKDYLAGRVSEEALFARRPSFYADKGHELRSFAAGNRRALAPPDLSRQ